MPIEITVSLIAVVSGAFGWLASAWNERRLERRLKQEQKYDDMIISFWGYYERMGTSQGVLDYTIGNRAWLHCPDSVILAIIKFQAQVKANPTDKVKAKQILGELILEIRRNNYSKCTNLKASDWEKQVKD